LKGEVKEQADRQAGNDDRTTANYGEERCMKKKQKAGNGRKGRQGWREQREVSEREAGRHERRERGRGRG
jgi:hypothetical protein